MLALQGKEGDPLTSSSPLHYHTKHSHWAVIEDGSELCDAEGKCHTNSQS